MPTRMVTAQVSVSIAARDERSEVPRPRATPEQSLGRLSDTGTPGADPGGLPEDASGPTASRPVLAPVPGRHSHAYGLDHSIRKGRVCLPVRLMTLAWRRRRYAETWTWCSPGRR